MMVVAGFGVCFLPEFSPTIPGLRTQPVSEPEVVRVVSLVSMAGRRFSPGVLAFIRAIRAHEWALDFERLIAPDYPSFETDLG